YTNAIPRLLAGLKVPTKGLIGPWAHKYPHFAQPGPAAGFLQDALRWWDKWLKGIETGIMDEPPLRAWMLESVRPQTWYAERPGRWIAESAWPSPGIKQHRLHLMDQSLADRAGAEHPLLLSSPESTGAHCGVWCPHGTSPDEPGDQREDDAKSLVFDTEPLGARLEILGAPVVELEVSADRPEAKLAVRLCDVHPDGASTRVTYGLLNLTHRESHEHPTPLEPGRRYKVRIQLNDIGYAVPPGHRLRIAVSSAYWPIAWPTPERVAVTLHTGSILLPVRAPKPEDTALPPLPRVESAQPEKRTVLRAGRIERAVERDIASGETVHRLVDDSGDVRIDAHGLEVGSLKVTEYRIRDDDPLSAVAEARWTTKVGRGAWHTRTETWTRMTATKDAFLLHATLDAYEGETRVWSQNWDCAVPRDLV
ncbi:MAG: CocE/NonD family hydrolase, partial [Stellaceae bacterium]